MTELSELLRLAGPLILSFIGTQLMGFVDTAMVGRLGAAAIGGAGIGGSLFGAVGIVGMGCVMGLDPLIAQALGAAEAGRARRLMWQGVRVAIAISVPLALVLLLAIPHVLAPMKIDAATAHETRRYLLGRCWNVIPWAIMTAPRSYLQAQGATRAIVVQSIVMNVVNFFGNLLLIFGSRTLHIPALGVLGTGISSTIASFIGIGVLAYAVDAIEAPVDRSFDPGEVKKILAVGTPIGLQLLAEVSAFSIAAMLAGRIGEMAAAGNQIALSLASMSFMVPLGIASATTVRVGQAIGRGDTAAARRAGSLGLTVAACCMGTFALSFLVAPKLLAGILTDKAAVIAAAAPLIRIAAVFQLSDGTQVVSAGALRGTGHTAITFYGNLVGHYAVGLPLAIALAFRAHLGSEGLWWGMSAGLTTVALILATRFFQITSRPIDRI